MTSADRATLFRDVRVFDGREGVLGDPSQVLVRGRRIEVVAPAGVVLADAEGATIVAGGGRTLIPGLIDAHWHSMMAVAPLGVLLAGDPTYLALLAGAAATDALMRGFTTVRDAGGPAFGLKQAIDSGVVRGPRIYPSGAMISQTSGHGDFRTIQALPRGRLGQHADAELIGAVAIADGVGPVLQAAREQLMRGASQLKVMAGGGVASPSDPLDGTQYTEPELRAAVDAAEDWGTYVMVHAYTPRAVQRCIRAGVRCIEHGQLLDEATAALMAEQGVWWSLQPFLDDEDTPPVPPASRHKFLQMVAGTDAAYELARKHGVRVAWGTDTLFSAELATRQGRQLAKMRRWYTPAEILTMATRTNATLLAMSGPRDPYPEGLGVVEAGALADLVLVDGDPLEDITLLARPESAFVVIMKDGVVVKDTLAGDGGSPVG
ncbi:MAG: amidohydrolase family protein [Chloroflexi bacterium]|nr:amidohydrolase family protein [Chloroflexota bacterium]